MSPSKEKLIHIANAIELLQSTLKCAICLEMLRQPVSTRCGHHFCNLCLTNLLNQKNNGRPGCPLCKTVISRRAIIQNEKIRRQVDSVHRLIKAIQADTSLDITQLRQAPSSTNEANSSVPGPSSSTNEHPRDIISQETVSEDRGTENITPKGSPPLNIASAEKVKTWLIQNNNDFEDKNILKELSHPSKPAPLDEDSDSDMMSVSQVPKKSQINTEPVKSTIEPVKIGAKPVRRSLKIKEIDKLTSQNTSKNTNELLPETGEASTSTKADYATVVKTGKGSLGKKTLALSNNKNLKVSKEGVNAKKAGVVTYVDNACDVPNQDSFLNKNDVPTSIHDNNIEEDCQDEEMPQDKSSRANSLQSSKKILPTQSLQTQSTMSSGLDSCEIIPPSEHVVDLPILRLKRCDVNLGNSQANDKKKSNSSKVPAKATLKRSSDENSVNPPPKRRSTSPSNGVAFLKAGRFGVSKKKANVRFVKWGRVSRERLFVPLDIRCHCVDKPMFLVDLTEPESKIPSVSEVQTKPNIGKEMHSIGVQTSTEPSQELQTEDTAMYTAADSGSEDMFPFSPEKIVQSGGEIIKRRSNNSSIVSDGIMDAVTVLLSQPAVAPRNKSFHQEPALQSPSESLLTKTPKSTSNISEASEKSTGKKSGAKQALKQAAVTINDLVESSDSEEEQVGPRKSTKRPRRLSSSDDSENGGQKMGRKKKKNTPLLKAGRMAAMEDDVNTSSLDLTLESPQRLVQGIKAKIAAGMLGKTNEKIQRRTSPRSSPRTPRINRQPSKLSSIDLATPSRKEPSNDSDLSDCEILEGTPQQNTSINTSRRSLRSAEENSLKVMNTTVAQTDSCTPGFVEPTQATFYELPPILDSDDKSQEKTKANLTLDQTVRESPKGKRGRAEKTPTPQRPLREKNTSEASMTNKTWNNISGTSTKEAQKKKEVTPRAVQKLPSKDLTPKKPAQKKMCFVCSGLPGNMTALVQKLAAQVGAKFSSKFDAQTTHLVVKTKEDNTTDKTLKYLCAVAAKKWVVSFQWVVDSIKEGKLLPEEKYEALDTTGASGPRLSRLSPKHLFSDFEFCVIPPFSDLTKEQLEELIQFCGAKVIADPKKFSFQDDVLPLCLAEWDESREQEYESWMDSYCVPLVQHEWVLECIGRFSRQSFWNLLMSDVSDDNLRNMGYPPELIEHPASDSTTMD